MYNFNTSIHRLLHDKLISSFTHHKPEALSLFTVGDIKAMGMEKLSAMPRIGKKIVYDGSMSLLLLNLKIPSWK